MSEAHRRAAVRPSGADAGTRTTLSVIAAEAGVSLATVSKVLNRRPDVSERTRSRVEDLLEQHRYRGPQRHGQGIVDLIFADLDSLWAVEILRGVESFFSGTGRAVAVSATSRGTARPRTGWTGIATRHQSGGVLLVMSQVTPGEWRQLQSRRVPVVVIDPADAPGPEVASVGATNWSGGTAATTHLIGLGHRRIAVVSGPADYLCSRARTEGHRYALEQAGLPYDPDLVRWGDFRYEGGFRLGGELLDAPRRPTAVFAGSDQQALGVVEAARRRGLVVPRDLSVVGFDDLPLAGWVSPPLTTVRQPLAEMGATAADMLSRLMDGQKTAAQRVELATELVVRESTAPPRRSRR